VTHTTLCTKTWMRRTGNLRVGVSPTNLPRKGNRATSEVASRLLDGRKGKGKGNVRSQKSGTIVAFDF
jgi:hypothetical protein